MDFFLLLLYNLICNEDKEGLDLVSAVNKKVATYVISSVASVINGTNPPENEGINWQSIIDFAKRQSLLNIVAYATDGLNNQPDEHTLCFLNEFRMQKIVVEAQQELAAQDICKKLDKMGVRHMLLKGSIIKNLYPSPDMRTMGDIDILIDSDRCDEVVKAFIDDGFEFSGEGDLHSNVKKGNAYIEFHHSMIDSSHKTLSAYYGDGFKLARKRNGSEFEYKLSDEDFFVFLVAHIAKHYRYGGTGIRSLLDLYVYEKKVPQLDMNKVEAELEKIGLLTFYKKIQSIAFNWFSGNFDGEFDKMSEYIIAGGVYGIEGTEMQNSYIFDHIDENIHFQKIKTLFKILFLGYDELKIRYPALEGKKILLPFFWIVRFVDTLIHNPRNAFKRLDDSKKILSIDEEMVEVQKISGIEKL